VELLRSVAALRHALGEVRAGGRCVGLVPTMGALHAGHRSLVERARAEDRHILLTIFVNPLQFERAADFERYPRGLDADLHAAAAMGVDTLFAPGADEMFPVPPLTTVSVGRLAARWEGASRPGHLDGVTTVVAKLFSLAGPCAAYFGEKDFQQLVVVRRMAADLSMPVEVVGCPTVRERDGLACSSRNALLDPPGRRAAGVLARALAAGREALDAGEVGADAVASAMAAVVGAEPLAALDYAAAVDPETLEAPATLAGLDEVRLLLAARVGTVRLIDNCAAPVGNNR
jgi:pantoate--beta-alanine ligase